MVIFNRFSLFQNSGQAQYLPAIFIYFLFLVVSCYTRYNVATKLPPKHHTANFGVLWRPATKETRKMQRITDKTLSSAKPTDRRYDINCEDNLFLEVMPTGLKMWRFRAQIKGRTIKETLGRYPDLSLHEARAAASQIRIEAENNLYKKKTAGRTLEEIYNSWYADKIEPLRIVDKTKYKKRLYASYILQPFGKRPIDAIDSGEILTLLLDIQKQGKSDIAHRILQTTRAIYKYAILKKACTVDPTYVLQGELNPKPAIHYPALTKPADIARFVMDIRTKCLSPITRLWLEIHFYLFTRPIELRLAKWQEFDIDAALWTIPPERMKMRREHLVPLCPHVIDMLRSLRKMTGHSQLLFPSHINPSKPLCENTENTQIRRMGWAADKICAHGFRGTASTALHDAGYRHEVIEKQLSHEVGNAVSQAYNRAEYLPERIELMNGYAEIIDKFIKKYTS